MTAREYKEYYDSLEFKEKYVYEGKDLGAVCEETGVSFKLWSPLAKQVILHLYEDGESQAFLSLPMKKGARGVWEREISEASHGTYYDYTVEFEEEVNQSADPWAKACNCNGNRSMVVDLSKTNPEGWETDQYIGDLREQIIYEMHIKDFSYNKASGIPEKYRGKYKAFTVQGTTLNGEGKLPTCLDYLRELGITHVQLMPVFDFGSVDEAGEDTQFNWGYDPVNYNVPEGSYSTDPYHGEVRIRELKDLVMSLHKNGLGVIMDVVYNHTFSLDSWFSRTNPYYFYRQFEDGSYSDGSDCGNDVACERAMCRKYILESVLYWVEEYHMDGFRFDLMGLLDVELLNEIRKELDCRYGEGKILLYGEPWSATVSPMEEGYLPCMKENIHLLDKNIGVFCDNTRDTIKGHVFYDKVAGFVNGKKGLEEKILSGVGAWVQADDSFLVKAPSQIITYISAHDNMTLWDKLMVTMEYGEAFTMASNEVIRAYKMAAAIYFTSQGRIFFLGGEEGARTKLGDHNSYDSSPELNQIDWNRIYEYEEILNYYKGLIEFRKQMPGLTDKSETAIERIFEKKIVKEGVLQFGVKNNPKKEWSELIVYYNSTRKSVEIELPEGQWELLISEIDSWEWKHPKTVSQRGVLPGVSVRVFGRIV